MYKNGTFYIKVVQVESLIASVWDPEVYRSNGDSHLLGDFADIHRISINKGNQNGGVFNPIEYKDIPPGGYLSFRLSAEPSSLNQSLPMVSEGVLLFGTMRAYLGNALVTPKAEWLGLCHPLSFSVKSEFVSISPHDGLTYYWLIYLRSPAFLAQLPLGSGGTRPRLNASSLGKTRVSGAPLKKRKRLDQELRSLAEAEWRHLAEIHCYLNEANP